MATYKKPSSFNFVSLALLVGVALAGYAAWSLWPVFSLNANVKNELEDALPKLYKMNLLPEPTPTEGAAQLHDDLITKLRALGVTDPKLDVVIERSPDKVAIQARYATPAVFKGINKERIFHMTPRVETSAARVDW